MNAASAIKKNRNTIYLSRLSGLAPKEMGADAFTGAHFLRLY